MAYKFGEAFIDLTANDKKLKGVLSSLKSVFTSFSNFIKKSILVGIGALSVGLIYATKQAMNFQEAASKLKNILKATGGAAGLSFRQITKFADAMQNVTKASNSAVLAGAGVMATFTKIQGDVFKKAIETAMNMAEVFGGDLRQAIISLGTALNDPVQGVGRLRRIGISFTETQKTMIKNFMDMNDVVGAQNVILDELQVEIGGAARAASRTAKGALAQLKNAFDDVARKIGDALLPGLRDLAIDGKKWLEKNETDVVKWGQKTVVTITLVKDLFWDFIVFMKNDWRTGFKAALDASLILLSGFAKASKIILKDAFIPTSSRAGFSILKGISKIARDYTPLGYIMDALKLDPVAYYEKKRRRATRSGTALSDAKDVMLQTLKDIETVLPEGIKDAFADSIEKWEDAISAINKPMLDGFKILVDAMRKYAGFKDVPGEGGGTEELKKKDTQFTKAGFTSLQGAWRSVASFTAGAQTEKGLQKSQLSTLKDIHKSVVDGTAKEESASNKIVDAIKDQPTAKAVLS